MPHATLLDRIAHLLELGGKLGAGAHRVLLVLLVHADRTGAAWPSMSRIAALAGCDEGSARRSLRELLGAGWVGARPRRGSSTVRSVAPDAKPGDLAQLHHRPSSRRGGVVGVGAPAAPGGSGLRTGLPTGNEQGGALEPSPPGRTSPPERGTRTNRQRSKPDVSIPPSTKRFALGARWGSVTDDLLETPDALLQALDGGGTMSESAKLRVLAAAHTARRSGRKPSALFVTLARDPGSSIPLADEDAGRRDLMQLQGRSPGPRKSTATVQVRPGLRVRVPEHERAGATPIGELLKGVC